MTFRRAMSLLARGVLVLSALVGGALVIFRLERDRPQMLLERAGAQIVDHPDGAPRMLQFSDGAAREEHLLQAAHLNTLHRIVLRGGAVGPHGLRALQSLRELRALDLNRCAGTPACLPEVGQLFTLRELYLQDCTWVTDDGMRYLQTLHALEFLDLSGTAVSDVGLASLHGCLRLNDLNLRDCSAVTDEGLLRLSSMASLRSVNCTGAKVTRPGARAYLRARPGSDLRTDSLDMADLQPLVDAGALIRLDSRYEMISIVWGGYQEGGGVYLPWGEVFAPNELISPNDTTTIAARSAVRVAPEALALLADCRHLNELDVRDVSISDAELAPLGDGSALRWITLYNCPIRGEGLQYLIGHHNLSRVRIGSAVLTNEALRQLGRMTCLESLEIERPEQDKATGENGDASVTDDGLRYLQGLSNLSSLSLVRLPLTGAGLEHLETLAALNRLTLRLDRWDQDSLRHVSRFSQLETLTVGGPVTADGMRHLSSAPILNWLVLDGADLDEEGARELAALPKLTTLQLSHGRLSADAIRALGGSSTLRYLVLRQAVFGDVDIEELRRARPEVRISISRQP